MARVNKNTINIFTIILSFYDRHYHIESWIFTKHFLTQLFLYDFYYFWTMNMWLRYVFVLYKLIRYLMFSFVQ
jgi:hypothetical protein